MFKIKIKLFVFKMYVKLYVLLLIVILVRSDLLNNKFDFKWYKMSAQTVNNLSKFITICLQVKVIIYSTHDDFMILLIIACKQKPPPQFFLCLPLLVSNHYCLLSFTGKV